MRPLGPDTTGHAGHAVLVTSRLTLATGGLAQLNNTLDITVPREPNRFLSVSLSVSLTLYSPSNYAAHYAFNLLNDRGVYDNQCEWGYHDLPSCLPAVAIFALSDDSRREYLQR